ncbi:hypothetical protein [Novosphingobium mathurense]|uniref:Uncharacterized protein n=1 Tax=Novosphingobium mathurense TaxID=428990 RepID=A0A1U6I6J1_9SPHN|nr:hypothetical protein [Novosphingobium mathurense]SLK03654.1 hypothetical protein SAMN06295987_104273 [Novosphingobium mathurense]
MDAETLRSTANHHAVDLDQCALFAADLGPHIAKAMNDAATFLRSAAFLAALEELATLKARCEALEGALRDIIAPISRMKRIADEEGRQLDGGMAVYLAGNVPYLQKIASDALAEEASGGN